MTVPPDPKLDATRVDLWNAKLVELLEWRRPQIFETVGPFDPSAFDRYDAQRRKIAEDCATQVSIYTDTEIEILIDSAYVDEIKIREQWSGFRQREIERLIKSVPPWYAGGFGHPDYAANFEYWCKMPRLSIPEVLSLSVGINPGYFDAKKISELKEDPRKASLRAPLRFLLDRHEQLHRQFFRAHYEQCVNPREFVHWSEKVDFHVHPEFIRLLKRYHLDSAQSGADPDKSDGSAFAKKPEKREIDTIAKLFTLMAIDHLGYVPGAKRSPIPGQIVDFAAEQGVQISDDTVRKYLRIGSAFITTEDNPTK